MHLIQLNTNFSGSWCSLIVFVFCVYLCSSQNNTSTVTQFQRELVFMNWVFVLCLFVLFTKLRQHSNPISARAGVYELGLCSVFICALHRTTPAQQPNFSESWCSWLVFVFCVYLCSSLNNSRTATQFQRELVFMNWVCVCVYLCSSLNNTSTNLISARVGVHE